MTFKNVFSLIKETYKEWTKDHASRLAAALAYYTIFSLAPLLVIVIAIAGFFFGREAITGEVVRQIGGLVGESGALAVQNLIIAAYKSAAGKIAAVLGLLTILYGASSFFGHLQYSLNAIWGVSTNPGRGIRGFIKDRFFSIVVVIGTGFLLLVSLIVSAAIDVIIHFFQGRLSGFDAVWTNLSFVFSFLVTSVIFALIFKVLPDVKIHWKSVFAGALITAFLFSLGRFLIGLYLGSGSFATTYGAAASFVIILVWIYYSAQILFLGAEFTQVYARRYGDGIHPAANAVAINKEEKRINSSPR